MTSNPALSTVSEELFEKWVQHLLAVAKECEKEQFATMGEVMDNVESVF